MLIGKYISSKSVIERLYRDNSYQTEIPFVDLISWIYDCLQEFGAPLQYVRKILGWKEREDYFFQKWKIQLPCDFHKLIGVAVNGITALPSTNNFHQLKDGTCCGLNNLSSDEQSVFTDNFGTLFSPSASPISGEGFYSGMSSHITFDINSNYITFNVKQGYVCMSYDAFPLDEEGFPYIPDDEIYIKYVSSYLRSKVDYISWRMGMLTDKVYEDTESKRMWSAGQVSAKARVPDELQMESLKNNLIKLIPRFQEFYSNFQNMNRNTDHH